MPITLLNAAKQVLGESGFDVPTGVVSADDKTFLYVACKSIRQLRAWQWQILVKSTTIAMTTATDYALASDFLAYVPDTLWSNGGMRPVNMPVTPNGWTILKSGIGLNPGQFNCRFIGGRLHVQNPEDGGTLRYEYVSKNALTDTGGTSKEMFTADTDICLLDDELFLADLKWRYKKEKGIDDWQVDFKEFERYRKERQGQDRGSQTLYPTQVLEAPVRPWFNQWQ
jgi:hypothetical protein